MDGYPVARLQSLAEEPPRHDGGRLVQSPVRHVFVAAEQRGLLWVPLRVTVESVNQGHERWIIPWRIFRRKVERFSAWRSPTNKRRRSWLNLDAPAAAAKVGPKRLCPPTVRIVGQPSTIPLVPDCPLTVPNS